MFPGRTRTITLRLLPAFAFSLSLLLSISSLSTALAENPSTGSAGPSSTISALCSPKLSPTSAGDRFVVSVPELNLRSGPST